LLSALEGNAQRTRLKPDGFLECLVEGDRGGDMRVFELIE
jgi:hypothetical protein